MEVTLRTQPDYHVAYLRYVGPYGTAEITQLWNVLKRWRQSQTWGAETRQLLGISHDDPTITPPHLCRYDVCVEFDLDTLPGGDFGVQTIPGGAYACARFVGPVAEIGAAWQWVFMEWLPANGYERDARPCYERYRSDMAELPEGGILDCEICIPVTQRRSRPSRR
ncbi:MAG: GyrI-like domain-containing protein [Uliginosibacterium sp.]|nr:GyrI-like domain-containing protein [Uliginosibacterium sp.]MBK9394888.1 GyrI-like domain-containing protein [Uliginosibacterium sp.]MBK9615447.1 GyrI-like domain-containing protein [Uliginosibacterium sp.]